MGGEAYYYVVPYEAAITEALEKLREREFLAGRYNPVMRHIPFPLTDEAPAPGGQHDSIMEAIEASAEEGTRSILDIMRISEEPDFCAACPLDEPTLVRLFGTARPSRAAVEGNLDFFDGIERGQAVYIVLYEKGRPTELFFAGYSFD